MAPIFVAIAIAGTLGAFTDWLFMGRLFHGAYNRYPEIWRPGIRDGGDRSAIILSCVLGYVITIAVVVLCMFADVRTIWTGLLVGVFAWLAGPAVMVVVNGLFIKMDPKVVVAHGLGYLARSLLAGLAAGIALSRLPLH
jgi:hypothetical protein